MSELAIFNTSAKDFEFLGFYMNGHHSSEYGLTVVAPSSFNQENLFAEFEDKIVNVNGKEGAYYFGTKYKTKTLNLSLAFDNMTSANKRAITSWLNPKIVSKLFLDESPYKYYWVKVAAPPVFSFIPFEETAVVNLTTTKTHIFKGTIDVQLIATDPFAYSDYALLSDVYVWTLDGTVYTRLNGVYGATNVPGWYGESGLHITNPVAPNNPLAKANVGTGYAYTGTLSAGTLAIDFYNGGTVPSEIEFTITVPVFNTSASFQLKNTSVNPEEVFELESLKYLSALSSQTTGTWRITCQPSKGLITATSSATGTTVYNLGALHNGVFVKVYPGSNTLYSSHSLTNPNIKYKYKYW